MTPATRLEQKTVVLNAAARTGRHAERLAPDLATIGGIVLAVASVLGGLFLEGGTIGDVAQLTAALIVLGGTVGAVLVTTPLQMFVSAMRKLPLVFFETSRPTSAVIDRIIALAARARTRGIVSLEREAEALSEPFLKKALTLAIDGAGVNEIRQMMELELAVEEHELNAEAKVYEAAGGYAPTVGIIGAIIGLMQVMKNLEHLDQVGRGIAVSFVATVYGIGLANLCFIPAANKLRARAARELLLRELELEGVIGIAEGLNPRLIRVKVEAYLQQRQTS